MGSWHKARVNSFSEAELNMREVSELFMSWKQKTSLTAMRTRRLFS